MVAFVPSLALLVQLIGSPPGEEPPVESSDELADEQPESTTIDEPSTQPVNEPAADGGFGSVDSVTTHSDVHAPPPPQPSDPNDESDPRYELSLLIEAGYGQASLANVEGLDHHGLFLRAHFVFFPWVSKRRRIAGGLGASYSYQGLNRWQLPQNDTLSASEAQQQEVMLSLDMLLRPHPQWFSIQASALIGLGFYTNAQVFAADRPATIAKDEYAFVAGASLSLCTAWDIACVVGGAETLLGVATVSIVDPESEPPEPVNIEPFGWHVGLGFDILRVLDRANRLPR